MLDEGVSGGFDFEVGWRSPAEKVFDDLHEDQAQAVLATLRTECLSPIVEAPTGSGKSWIAAALAQDYIRSGAVLVTQHRDTLARQNYAVMERKCGVRGTFYGAGLGQKRFGRLTYANIATLHNTAARRPHEIPTVAAMIVDECHRVPNSGSGMYRTVIAALRERNPECRLIGMSATPFRGTGESLCDEEGALFDEIVYRIDIRSLIAEGRLVPPIPYAARNALDVSKLRVRAGEFRDEEQAAQIDPAIGSIAAELVQAGDQHGRRAAVAMLPRVKQSEALAEELRRMGQTAISVTMDTPNREAILQDFRDGRIRFLTSVSVLVEGFDATVCDTVALICATRSPVKYIQSIGRGLRSHEGKKDCLVLDFGGNTHRFGPIDDVAMPRKGKLGEPKMKECKACGFINRPAARVCEGCGMPFGGRPRGEPELNTRSDTGRLLSDKPRALRPLPRLGDRETFAPTSVDMTRIPPNRGRGTPAWVIVHFRGEGGVSADLKLFPNHPKAAPYFLPKLQQAFGLEAVSAVAPAAGEQDRIGWLERHIRGFPVPISVTRVRTEFKGRRSWEAGAFRQGRAAPPPPPPPPAYDPYPPPPPARRQPDFAPGPVFHSATDPDF